MIYFCNLRQYHSGNNDIILRKMNRENDEEYCYRVAKEAKKVGEIIYKTLTIFGLNVTSLASLERIYDDAKYKELNGLSQEDLIKRIDKQLTT